MNIGGTQTTLNLAYVKNFTVNVGLNNFIYPVLAKFIN